MADSMSAMDVLIRIVTVLKKDGVEAAQQEAAKLKKQLEDTGGGSDKLKGALDALSGKSKDASDGLRALYVVMNTDGVSSSKALGTAITKLGGTFGTMLGPLGSLATLGMAGFQVFKTLAAKQDEVLERLRKLDEEEKRVQKSADDAVSSLLDLDKARFDAAKGEVENLREEIEALDNAAKSARARLDAIEDAELEVDIAKIDARVASGEIDSTEGEWLKGNVRTLAAQRKDDRELADLGEEESRLGNAAKSTAKAVADAAAALEAAQGELAEAEATVAHLRKRLKKGGMGMLAYNDTQRELKAALQVRQDAAQKVADASTAESAASAAAEDAQARLDARMPDIETRRQVLGLKREARGYADSASDSKRATAIRAEMAAEQEKKEKAEKEAREKAAAAAAAAASTPRALAAEVGGMVGIGQRDAQGQLYDTDVDGGAVRRNAMSTLREAVNAAASSKGGDAEEAAIIGQAVDAIQSMGANLLADKAQINAKVQELVNAIQKIESQTKNARS